jgi:hypothetical protein
MKLKSTRNRKNSIPFLLLLFIHIGLFILTLNRRNKKDVWILFLTNTGLAYIFEYFTLNLFHGYRYKPGIMKERFFDAILGAVLSQGLYVPVTATFLTLFQKNWIWKVSISLMYFYIEQLFKYLGIYKVYWWKSIYTPVLLNFYFYISDFLQMVLKDRKNWALKMAHYLSIEVIWITLMFIFAKLRVIRFGRGRYHTWTEHFIIAPLYSLFLSFIALLTSAKSGWYYRFLQMFIHIVIDFTLSLTGILKIKTKPFLKNIPRYSLMPFVSRYFYKIIFNK